MRAAIPVRTPPRRTDLKVRPYGFGAELKLRGYGSRTSTLRGRTDLKVRPYGYEAELKLRGYICRRDGAEVKLRGYGSMAAGADNIT